MGCDRVAEVPGHSNIPGNEIADEEAKKATEEEEVGRPVSLAAVKPAIKSYVKDGAIVHQRTRQVYSCKSKQKDKLIRNRSEQVLLARVRSGHHPALGTYKQQRTQQRTHHARAAWKPIWTVPLQSHMHWTMWSTFWNVQEQLSCE